ncbi:universal stress protein [Azospirillum sp.]|uniref:universal stress protein n=1 Tax=Azospirillum sp. TaxID=34012 RepID=UPI002D3729D0|nr:universal stress protein [Azospirillum sp.]HYD70238.1 universal stress protein [Azospirillum sp.]
MTHRLKRLLVPVHDAAAVDAALPRACRLAACLGSVVEVLYLRGIAVDRVLLGEGAPPAALRHRLDEAEGAEDRRMAAAQAAVDLHSGTHPGTQVRWRVAAGAETAALARHGRLCDLIVLPRHRGNATTVHGPQFNAALFETGRPVLLLPETGDALPVSRVAVAWDGSVQAGRALADALPLLAGAESVTVLRVSDDPQDGEAEEVVAYLADHGIAAAARRVAPAGSVADTLRAEVAAAGIDLLVMGAYGHSRLRERVLGGVSRSLLSSAPVPILLAH